MGLQQKPTCPIEPFDAPLGWLQMGLPKPPDAPPVPKKRPRSGKGNDNCSNAKAKANSRRRISWRTPSWCDLDKVSGARSPSTTPVPLQPPLRLPPIPPFTKWQSARPASCFNKCKKTLLKTLCGSKQLSKQSILGEQQFRRTATCSAKQCWF